jgi:glycosyltransferase involved in cell wall biosynthesis
MALGVPVLTSNVSSMPEVAGGAAVLVDPHSTGEIRAGIERLMLSPSLREKLSAKGRKRAQAFHWETSAKKTWRFFEDVCGLGERRQVAAA